MKIRRRETSNDVAVAGANFIYARAGEAIAERNQFTLALSGGSTPWHMLGKLAEYELPQIATFRPGELASGRRQSLQMLPRCPDIIRNK